MHVHQGYILAKAIRITDISQPGNIETFELQETIKTDDVISSFILKACLFNDNRNTGFFLKEEFFDCFTPYDVCTKIYELLHQYLNEKVVRSEYSNEFPIRCHNWCDVERGCCKRRKLMLAMVEKILQWLKENEHQLQDIDYAVDVSFLERNEVFE